MANPTGKGGFKKGDPGNPGGLTKEQRAARDAIRTALSGEKDKVHTALIALIEGGNAPATIYAHQLLHGKEPDAVNVKHSGQRPIEVVEASSEHLIEWLKSKKPTK